MLVAVITLWAMFSLWLIAPLLHMPHGIARVAIVLTTVELLALLAWSYGDQDCATCTPVAQAAGIAARTDIPVLAAAFVVAVLLQLRRR